MTESKLGKLIAAGWTAQIYEWENDRVVKLFFADWPLSVVENEANTMQLAKKVGLPVPDVDGVISRDNRHGIVMERIEGLTMLQCMLSRFWETNRYARIFAKLQTMINTIKAPEAGQPVRRFLEYRINNEKFIQEETKKTVLCILEKLPDGDAACHFDFHPKNVIMSPRGPVIIDWTIAHKGDPMADVARTWLLCTLPPVPGLEMVRGLLYLWLRRFYAEYLKEYMSHSDISEERLNLWKFPILAARISEERTDSRKKFLLKVLKKKLASEKM